MHRRLSDFLAAGLGRSRAYGLAALLTTLLIAIPTSAEAVTKPPPPTVRPIPYVPYHPPLPPPPKTVDHPAVDGLRSYDNGPRRGEVLALTFDADMTPYMLGQLQRGAVASWYNGEVVDVLRQEGVSATIFLSGLWAQTYPDVARALASDPNFEIGSHTFDHRAFRTPCYNLSAATDRAWEIQAAQDSIRAATGVTPRLLRFPGDCYDATDVGLAAAGGLSVISGDVRGGDGFNPSSATIVRTVLSQARAGSIVLLHLQGGPNAPMTAPALRQLIPALRASGYRFATVSDLLGLQRAYPPPPVPIAVADVESPAAPRPDSTERDEGDPPASTSGIRFF